MYKIRPGHVGEASIVGVIIVMLGVVLGRPFAESAYGQALLFSKPTLCIILPVYAAIASILPVWVLMCPRDYLSSYMKVGVIVVLAAGLLLVQPDLRMPATTPFTGGGGPIVSGSVWPFVCIVIMCGALSGFHALVATGTTPKMVSDERSILPIGYGAMLLEGFVAVTALIAACSLEPGDYFRINYQERNGRQTYAEFSTEMQRTYHWDVREKDLATIEAVVEEKLSGRVGGAVTLAVGMAKVFSSLPGMKTLMAYWYHFILMFEALFILTVLETGTRVARFILQESIEYLGVRKAVHPGAKWGWNIGTSLVTCLTWGFLLYTGNLNDLWRMFGVANQMLATIGLALGTVFILRNSSHRAYALITFVPLCFVVSTIYTGTFESIQSWYRELSTGLPPAKLFFNELLCVLSTVLAALVGVILLQTARRAWSLCREPARTVAQFTESE